MVANQQTSSVKNPLKFIFKDLLVSRLFPTRTAVGKIFSPTKLQMFQCITATNLFLDCRKEAWIKPCSQYERTDMCQIADAPE